MPIVLQISDPHLMSGPADTLRGVPTAKALKSVVNEAHRRFPDPDRVVWSGDLSHEHSVAGYKLLREIAADWVDRSLFIPGNHDDRGGLRQVFDQVPGTGSEDVCFRCRLQEWLLIGLDSHVPGDLSGELSKQTITRLESWLSADPERPTLIFLHHPPRAVGSAWIDAIGLRNPEPLRSLLKRSPGVKGIFCGHIHQVYEGHFSGVPLYATPSASFQFKPGRAELQLDVVPPGFRWIKLDGNRFETGVIRLEKTEFPPSPDAGRS